VFCAWWAQSNLRHKAGVRSFQPEHRGTLPIGIVQQAQLLSLAGLSLAETIGACTAPAVATGDGVSEWELNSEEQSSIAVRELCQVAMRSADELGWVVARLILTLEHRAKGFSFVFSAHQEEHIGRMVQQRGREGDAPGLKLGRPNRDGYAGHFIQDFCAREKGSCVTVWTQTQQSEIELRNGATANPKIVEQILFVTQGGPAGIGVFTFDAMQLRR
jgi:hypothetical protein